MVPPLIRLAEICSFVPVTLNVVPVCEPEPSITLPVPEIVDVLLPVAVTVPPSIQATGPWVVFNPPVDVNVPPLRVSGPNLLT